jgi:NAD(P)-dependent dehydrogenase (short-subunit alcohol dehydrogenase family)
MMAAMLSPSRLTFLSEADVLRMFDAVRSEFGAVDILINNAGLQSDAPFIEMTRAQW